MQCAVRRYLPVAWQDRKGVTAIEYAVLASFICAAVAIPVFRLGGSLQGMLALPTVFGHVPAANPATQPAGGSTSGGPSGTDHYGDH